MKDGINTHSFALGLHNFKPFKKTEKRAKTPTLSQKFADKEAKNCVECKAASIGICLRCNRL